MYTYLFVLSHKMAQEIRLVALHDHAVNDTLVDAIGVLESHASKLHHVLVLGTEAYDADRLKMTHHDRIEQIALGVLGRHDKYIVDYTRCFEPFQGVSRNILTIFEHG